MPFLSWAVVRRERVVLSRLSFGRGRWRGDNGRVRNSGRSFQLMVRRLAVFGAPVLLGVLLPGWVEPSSGVLGDRIP